MNEITTTKSDSFFVSYNKEDREWAEWIAWVLEKAKYDVFIQAWDIRPGNNFVIAMQNAAASNKRTVAVLSSHYLLSKYTQPEWASAFSQDPTGEKGILLPVRIEDVKLDGLWLSIVYIDLVGLSSEEAEQALLEGVALKRAKPAMKPTFPGKKNDDVKKQPDYPLKFTKQDPLKDWSVMNVGSSLEDNNHGFILTLREKSSRIVRQSTLISTMHLVEVFLSAKDNSEHEEEKLKDFQVLYELLVPTDFREGFSQADKIYIIVDNVTAAIPWEGIFAFPNLSARKSIREKTEVIRQLMVTTFRDNSSFEYENNALLIGYLDDKQLQSKTLDRDIDLISNILINSGFTVNTLITKNASNILFSLFENTYKVLHIEGIVHFDEVNMRSGISIGSDIYLTPLEISQMSVLPQLIYINFNLENDIPDIDPASESQSIVIRYYKMAANLATELISIGVKSVVISSFPLKKNIRLIFAKTFYQALLNGETFSHAVKMARQAIYEAAPGIETLTGFQCYGEINFTLTETGSTSLISK
jgi:hypothetical protein